MKKIRDIGVPEEMPPEEAKYIRALNIGVFLAWLPHVMWSLQVVLMGRPVPAATHLAWVALLLSNFAIIHQGRYLVAKILLVVLLNPHTIVAAVFFHGQYDDKWNLLYAAVAPFIFAPPKNQVDDRYDRFLSGLLLRQTAARLVFRALVPG